MSSPVWISTSSGDFNVGANWSTGSAPVAGDSPVFNGTGTANVTTNLDQHTVAFGPIYIYQANTCQIGTLVNGVPTYFQHASASVIIGQPTSTQDGQGSNLVLMDSGSTACTYEFFNSSSSSADPAFNPIQIKGSSLALKVSGGSIAVAPRPGETATCTLNIVAANGAATPNVYLGVGVTCTTLNALAGTVFSQSGQTMTTGAISGTAAYTYIGTGAHTTLTIGSGGYVTYAGTGTVTTLNLTGTFDRTQDTRSMTITNTNLYIGFSFLLNNGVSGSTVRTNPPALVDCGMQDGTFSSPIGDLV